MKENRRAEGRIIKGVGGYYYVETSDGSVYECRARGLFRKQGIKPAPGDYVEFSLPTDTIAGNVEVIKERMNALKRPYIANVDQLMVVIAKKRPDPDLLLVDRLLIYARLMELPVILVQNKDDLTGEDILSQYRDAEVMCMSISVKTGTGLGEIREVLRGKTTCLAGQSAVGKSSLINAMDPSLSLDTGELAKKADRGTHTTRHSEFMRIDSLDCWIVDTPGFSILENAEMSMYDLKDLYPEFTEGAKTCRFDRCVHINEPDCGVKEMLKEGRISQERYERYKRIYNELKEREMNRYD